ncbi:PhoU domain-containing protein [Chloroflexota bacterium]
MVGELFHFWRGAPLMKKALNMFGDMLGNCDYLLTQAWETSATQDVIDRIPQSFYDVDIATNNQEREIRQLLLEHLSLHPTHDTSGCLALMSLVKDAERIGDYAKNIFEVAVLNKGTIKDIKYFERISAAEQRIASQLPLLKQAFMESDEKLAEEILKNYTPIKRECDYMLQDLYKDQLSTQEAVATALLSRYLKRINSHLSNIASGIIYPLNEIDFVRGDILE